MESGASAGYDITVDIRILPGSVFLQACFYGIAVAIVAAAMKATASAVANAVFLPRAADEDLMAASEFTAGSGWLPRLRWITMILDQIDPKSS